jgi:hypothetical protein
LRLDGRFKGGPKAGSREVQGRFQGGTREEEGRRERRKGGRRG